MKENPQYQQIVAWVQEQRDDIIADLRDLVNIPSVADRKAEVKPFGEPCRKVLECILEKGRKNGFTCCNYDNYGGSILGKETKENRKHVGLWAHLDVVPEGDGWDFPPFSMTEQQGWLIGRGVQDNKSAAVAIFYVLKAMEELELSKNCIFDAYFGCAEEIGMYDVKYIKEHYQLPPVSVVVDCGFPVCYGESGILNMEFEALEDAPEWLLDIKAGSAENTVPEYAEITLKKDGGGTQTLRTEGKAVHTGVAETGKNALYSLMEKVKETEKNRSFLPLEFPLEIQNLQLFSDCFMGSGEKLHGAITLAGMRERKVTFHLDIRYPILNGRGQLTDGRELQKRLEQRAEACGLSVNWCKNQRPSYYPPDKKEVKVLEKAFQKFGGYTNGNYCMSGGTYARELPQAFAFGMALPEKKLCPYLAVGGDYHQPNESLNIEEYMKAITLLIACLAEFDKNI
jgi:succinyl-diaminopimelate desuccinylase